MRRVVLVTLGLTVAAILFTVCSKKSTKTESRPPDATAPVIDSLSLESGWPGDVLAIFGSQFDATIDSTKHVLLGDSAATVRTWSDSLVEIDIPDRPGRTTVSLHNGHSMSNVLPFGINGIVAVEPESGQAGDTIRILGLGFGDSQDSSTIEIAGVTADVVSWSDKLVKALVPESADGSGVRITADGHTSVWNAFELLLVPVIDRLSSESGWPGDVLAILGYQFETVIGSARSVLVGDSAATVRTWSDTLVEIDIPDRPGKTTVGLHNGQSMSNLLPFGINGIVSVEPESGQAGDTICILGLGFGDSQNSSTIELGGASADVVSWSDTLVEALVSDSADSVGVRIMINDHTSVWDVFETLGAPVIRVIQPDWGSWGIPVTIEGSRFGHSPGQGTVTFNGVHATILSWANDEIVAEVPEQSGSGMVQITIGDMNSNSVYFDVFHIIEIFPDSGNIGSSFYIKGEGFGAIRGDGRVRLGEMWISVFTWNDTLIAAKVPTGAISDSIVVYKNDQQSNGKYFRISSHPEYPVIHSISPDTLYAGLWIEVWGSNFGNGLGDSYISIGGVHWSDSCNYMTPSCWWIDYYCQGPVRVCADPGEIGTTDIFVVAHGAKSNVVCASLLGTPIIHDVYPDTVVYGDEIQITGTLFLGHRGEVSIGGTKADLLVWSDELITALVPEGARPGNIRVRSRGGYASSLIHVVAIENMSPGVAFVGDTVRVIGCGFGDEQGSNCVKLGTEEITVLSWSDWLIEFEVTDQMSSGDVRVAVGSVVSNSAYLDANPSLPNLTPYLQQTNHFEAFFSGTIETTDGQSGNQSVTLLIIPDDSDFNDYISTSSWESNDFHGTMETGCWQVGNCIRQTWLDGSVSAGGLSVDSVHCKYTDDRDEIGPGVEHVHHEIREFTLIDVPLSYVSVDDSIVIRYELSGPAVRDHMANIFMTVSHYEYCDIPPVPPYENRYGWTLSHVIWDDAANPPRIRITFRKTD